MALKGLEGLTYKLSFATIIFNKHTDFQEELVARQLWFKYVSKESLCDNLKTSCNSTIHSWVFQHLIFNET